MEYKDLTLQPISYREACEFVRQHHRHRPPPQGWKFGVAISDGEKIVGVATVGRPVNRAHDDGWTLEVTRCCTDGSKNAASMLYGAAWRAARALGYKRLITYTLQEEPGTSLRASNWRVVYQTERGSDWNRKGRPHIYRDRKDIKTLWEQVIE